MRFKGLKITLLNSLRSIKGEFKSKQCFYDEIQKSIKVIMDNFFEIIRQLRNTSYFKHQGKICKKLTTVCRLPVVGHFQHSIFYTDFLGFNLCIELTGILCYHTIT